MSSSAPTRGTTAQPAAAMTTKRPINLSEAERQHRIVPPQMCTDARTRLDNIRRLSAAAETEYRKSMMELDSLDREGRWWLAVDFIHKTALASLDMAASLMSATGQPQAELGRTIADGTQTASDTYLAAASVLQNGGSVKDALRTAASRAVTHTKTSGAGGAYAKGTADLALTGWSNLDNIIAAQGTPSATARTTEAGIEGLAGMVQRTADTMAASPGADKIKLNAASGVAGVVKATSAYNREIEGVFNRRLEIKSGLDSSRAMLTANRKQVMDRFRKQTEEVMKILSTCE
ncbi:hypothetical protein [Paracoccus aminophilus]|uniref:Uncharacterized protein n=1 Tax=Paracoccus aminophilus JCM 7686 TaxID=1367847 RepID=S5XKB7_PARAH|nr:hypothetical protein [Paracoccus aminophilus]AGT07639.1 hypothetical protein JCM7686_0530 [Paracoccus aminophilus JCM 7686]